MLSAKYDTLYLSNECGRLLALNRATGAARWRKAAITDLGDSASETTPYVLQVKDAIVAVAGDTAFSVRPDRPTVLPSSSSGSPTPSKATSPATVVPTPGPTEDASG